jgi:two-component system sensor histidine kinase/response regulator
MKGEAEHCLACGMDAYLTKPIRLQELAVQLARYSLTGPSAPAPDPNQTPEGNTPPPGALQVWRAQALSQLVSDDVATQKRLLAKFLPGAGTHVDTILAAAHAGQWTQVADVAHTLKSSARTVGADQLGALCQQIESGARSGDTAACVQEVQQLPGAFAAAQELILASIQAS